MGRACHSLHTRVYPGAYGTRTLFLHPCLAATTCRLLARLRCGCPGPDYNFLYPFSSGSSSSLPNRHALTGSDWALCHPLQTTHPRQGQTTRTGGLMRKTPAPAACRRGRPHRLGPPPAGRRPPPLRMQPRWPASRRSWRRCATERPLLPQHCRLRRRGSGGQQLQWLLSRCVRWAGGGAKLDGGGGHGTRAGACGYRGA